MYEQTLAYVDRQMRACAKGQISEAVVVARLAKVCRAVTAKEQAEDEFRKSTTDRRRLEAELKEAIAREEEAADASYRATAAFFSAIDKPL